jgi:hypothetical protein
MNIKEIDRKLQLAQNTITKIAEANKTLGNSKVSDEMAYSAVLIKEAREDIARK